MEELRRVQFEREECRSFEAALAPKLDAPCDGMFLPLPPWINAQGRSGKLGSYSHDSSPRIIGPRAHSPDQHRV